MSLPPTEAMKRIAEGLLSWPWTRAIGATDVQIWFSKPGQVRIAFVGPALKLQRIVNLQFPNSNGVLDVALQRAVGLPGEIARWPSGQAGPRMQTMEIPDPFLDSVLEGVGGVAREVLGDADYDYADATLMPDVGAPWSPKNTPTPFYSAAKRKVLVTERPAWLVEVELDPGRLQEMGYTGDSNQTRTIGADICRLAPRITSCTPTVVGMLPERKHFEFLVTHSLRPGARMGAEDPVTAAQAIKACGGLPYPSLAVGIVPASIFGPLALIAGVDVALAGMSPYKKRGLWPVVLYSTDAWTVVSRAVFTRGAIELFGELTGNRDFGYNDNFWTVGAPIEWAKEEVKLLSGTKQMASALIRRAKKWPRGLTNEQMEAKRSEYFAHGSATADYYPYLEAKVNGILSMGCFPLAVFPKQRKREYMRYLDATGFSGDVLALDIPESVVRIVEGQDASDDAVTWEYAWLVRDAVLQYASRRPTVIFAVDEG